MRAYLLSPEAEIDLQEIEEYSALQWGDTKAAEYIEELFDAFELLAEHPGIGKPKLRKKLLTFPLNRHIILFSVDRKAEKIHILRVLHSAMNIKARLRKTKRP